MYKIILLLALISVSFANVSLGDVKIYSKLGYKLNATIPFQSNLSVDDITIEIASPEEYAQSQIKTTVDLYKILVKLIDNNGQKYINVYSNEVLSEDSINLFIKYHDKDISDYKYKNFAILLDPIDYGGIDNDKPQNKSISVITRPHNINLAHKKITQNHNEKSLVPNKIIIAPPNPIVNTMESKPNNIKPLALKKTNIPKLQVIPKLKENMQNMVLRYLKEYLNIIYLLFFICIISVLYEIFHIIIKKRNKATAMPIRPDTSIDHDVIAEAIDADIVPSSRAVDLEVISMLHKILESDSSRHDIKIALIKLYADNDLIEELEIEINKLHDIVPPNDGIWIEYNKLVSNNSIVASYTPKQNHAIDAVSISLMPQIITKINRTLDFIPIVGKD